MTARDDLQADLDAIADDIDNRSQWHHTDAIGMCGACEVVERLRHLLDDRDLSDAPLTSEIIAHLEAGGTVERWSWGGGWHASTLTIESWRLFLAERGDQRQHGVRLGALRPTTERVLLHKVKGRTLPGATSPVADVTPRFGGRWRAYYDHAWHDLDIAEDGTVEVLR